VRSRALRRKSLSAIAMAVDDDGVGFRHGRKRTAYAAARSSAACFG
jgi:hypothetical protein